VPLVGEWNSDKKEGVSLYDPSTATFYLSDRLVSGTIDYVITFEEAETDWTPLVGCWAAVDQETSADTQIQGGLDAKAVDQIDLASLAAEPWA